jgi:hypothetical protein
LRLGGSDANVAIVENARIGDGGCGAEFWDVADNALSRDIWQG